MSFLRIFIQTTLNYPSVFIMLLGGAHILRAKSEPRAWLVKIHYYKHFAAVNLTNQRALEIKTNFSPLIGLALDLMFFK
ncbi:hypothetical protein B1L02_23165 [Pseudoalteromonas piscicida]|nr:hypothetical protein B1L02_23165 [Pseudoalteromonas piscicida]